VSGQDVLRVEGVRKEFDEVVAVDLASFSVRGGEIFGLLGPNGAGKTTLIRMILGILQPDTGSITTALNGDGSRLNKTQVGYLPEERGLYEERVVGETLLYFAGLHGMNPRTAKERALMWLERLDLDGTFPRRLKELSKGMQQKVQFIAAVLHQPPLVVLDEPFSGLDPISQDLFRDIIQELTQEGMTVLLSSHQMNLVESLCDRVFLIDRGQQVLYGNLDKIKSEHGEDVVWIKYQCQSEEDLFRVLSESIDIRINRLKNGTAELVLPKGTTPNILMKFLLEHVEVEELKIAKPSLHQLFVEIVRSEQ